MTPITCLRSLFVLFENCSKIGLSLEQTDCNSTDDTWLPLAFISSLISQTRTDAICHFPHLSCVSLPPRFRLFIRYVSFERFNLMQTIFDSRLWMADVVVAQSNLKRCRFIVFKLFLGLIQDLVKSIHWQGWPTASVPQVYTMYITLI